MNIPADRANSQQNLKVVVERIFPAPRPRVFQAWVDPALDGEMVFARYHDAGRC